MGKTRNFAFTYYKMDLFSANFEIGTKIKYLIMGKETCPKTKKLHIQGFMILHNPVVNGKKILNSVGFDNTVHIEPAVAGIDKNIAYCSKDNDYLEFGQKPVGSGKRTDLDIVKNVISTGGGMKEVIGVATNYQSLKMGEFLLKYNEKKRPIEKIKVYWYYGPAGSGKTRAVWDKHDINEIFRPFGKEYKWWEGYDGHKIILLDDFRVEDCSFVRLLQLLDIYPFKVETKGGSREAHYTTVYVTAPNDAVTTWANETKEGLDQLTRRITLEQRFGTEVEGNTNLDQNQNSIIVTF